MKKRVINIKKCSIIGLGKLGACMAAALASRGFKVIGVDKDPRQVAAINNKIAPVFEPGLQGFITKYGSRIQAVSSYDAAVRNSDATFIVVPTPSGDNGDFSLKYVKQAIVEIGKALSKKAGYHIVVVVSTVLPGALDFHISPLLEKSSGKRLSKDLGLCYNPEFIALGTVMKNFLNPDFVLIGESDETAGGVLRKFYGKICGKDVPVARMNFVNAELTKIALNSFITMKITFANMLAQIAGLMPHGDVDTVTAALGLDSRIGRRYLKGGLGYGGPCFPRDNSALAFVAKKFKSYPDLAQATDKLNRSIVSRLFNLVKASVSKDSVTGILGLSYKPLSNVLEESQGFLLAERLIKTGVGKIVLYDPLTMDSLKKLFGKKAVYAGSAKELIRLSDVIVIANPDPEFSKLDNSDFLAAGRPALIIDCWRILRHLRFLDIAGIEYKAFGIGPG